MHNSDTMSFEKITKSEAGRLKFLRRQEKILYRNLCIKRPLCNKRPTPNFTNGQHYFQI